MRKSIMKSQILTITFGILSLGAYAVPFPEIKKRQLVDTVYNPFSFSDIFEDTMANDLPVFEDDSYLGAGDVAFDDGSMEVGAGDPQFDNMIGNSFMGLDNSINIDASQVDYPDASQLTGNTGTAISGDNNDVIPIVNAPFTVIINSPGGDDKDKSKGKSNGPVPPMPWNDKMAQVNSATTIPPDVQQFIQYIMALRQL